MNPFRQQEEIKVKVASRTPSRDLRPVVLIGLLLVGGLMVVNAS